MSNVPRSGYAPKAIECRLIRTRPNSLQGKISARHFPRKTTGPPGKSLLPFNRRAPRHSKTIPVRSRRFDWGGEGRGGINQPSCTRLYPDDPDSTRSELACIARASLELWLAEVIKAGLWAAAFSQLPPSSADRPIGGFDPPKRCTRVTRAAASWFPPSRVSAGAYPRGRLSTSPSGTPRSIEARVRKSNETHNNAESH